MTEFETYSFDPEEDALLQDAREGVRAAADNLKLTTFEISHYDLNHSSHPASTT